MSSYLRLILDRNMFSNSSSYTMVEERHEIRSSTRKVVRQEQVDPTWQAIKKELSPILEKRKIESERWIVQ